MTSFPDGTNGDGGRGQLVLALVFLFLSGLMVFLPPAAQEDVSRALRSSVLQPFVFAQQELAEARRRGVELEDLRARMDSLVALTARSAGLREENQRLRDLLDLQERGGPGFVAATVIRPGTQGSESIFVVDVGARDGVEVNAPVVADDGLVGVIREVSTGTAVGMDWTHPDFRASVMTADGAFYGIAEPERGAFREVDRLLLDGLPFHADPGDSTLVLTSGLGGIYPRGLVVGKVAELREAAAGWRRSYWLQPAVDVGSVTHALVLTGEAREGPPGGAAGNDTASGAEGAEGMGASSGAPGSGGAAGAEGTAPGSADEAPEEGLAGWSFLWLDGDDDDVGVRDGAGDDEEDVEGGATDGESPGAGE